MLGASCVCPVLLACARGSYGQNCMNPCRCRSDAVCDHVSGHCQCRMGFSGDQCDVPCDRGHYGPGCVESCDCLNAAACDAVTGCCDCTSGWYGQHCQLGTSHMRESTTTHWPVMVAWSSGITERRPLADVLSLSCARSVADG